MAVVSRGPTGRAGVRVVVAGARVAAMVAGLLVGGPSFAHAGDGDPPILPAPSTGCVGASPVQFAGVPWAVARMAPQRAWPLSRGAGQTVAVVDTGASPAAAALAGAVLPGLDVVAGGPANSDCAGRGTALAGIVAARPKTGTGVVGMAPGASVLPIRITDSSARVPPDALAKGITAAASSGVDVIVVGSGTTADSGALRTAVAAAAAGDIVVIAAINDQQPTSDGKYDVWYPAAYPDVIAVGGVDMDGKPIVAAPAAAGVDLLAPGAAAISCGPTGAGHYLVGGPAVAAAYVAGAAALVRSYRPQLKRVQVRERLELTAEHPPGRATTPETGAGTIDPYAAIVDVAPVLGSKAVASPRPAVVLASPPPQDPAPRRAGVVAGVVSAVAVAVLAIGAMVRVRRRRPSS